ncbi:hypothetical protein TSOC_002850, partial [Tetrabaena socialis]
ASDELGFTREDDDETKVKALEFYFPRGEQVWVKISEVSPDDRNPGELRLSGSLKAVDQQTGADLDPEGRLAAAAAHGGGGGGGGAGGPGGRGGAGPETDEPPEVGSIHRATVKRIEAYGVFVALEGFRRHGLVHTSQVSNYLSFTREDTDEQKKAELGGVVTVGEQMWVKVRATSPRVRFSRAAVAEGRAAWVPRAALLAEGLQRFPWGLWQRYRPRDAQGRGGGEKAAIGANAGEVGRGGKIDWGHLAADTKLYVNPKEAAQYKLLEDELPAAQRGQQQAGPPGGPGYR